MLTSLVALSLLAASTPPPKPFTEVMSVEGITEYSLPNGMRVLFVPDPSKPTVTVNLTVFVGSRHENYGEKGMAHLFEHMLFKRTKKFASVKDELTKLGGWANGSTWLDRTNYFESFPADDAKLQRAIELEAERLRNAVISKDQLATEMTVVRNELEIGENEPSGVLGDRVLSTAFLWHNYGDSTIGPRSDIERVPNEKLLAWYETYYQPDNAMLVIAGKFDAATTFKAIAGTFGRFPKPKRALPSTYTEEPTQDGERSVFVRRVGGTPYLQVGYHIPSAGDPDYPTVEVLQRVLGASPGGRLYKAVVEPKKAATVDCWGFSLKDPGFFSCYAQLQAKESTAPAREAMLAAIESFGKTAPTLEEVERAKTASAKDIDLLLNDSTRVGIYLTEFAAMGDWRLLFAVRDRVEQVTPDDVARVAAKYFKASNRTFGEYVPTEKPDRAEVAAAPDLAQVLKGYQGRSTIAAGEAFDPSPKNIDALTERTTLPNGMKLALLPKKTRGETVQISFELRYGTEKALDGQSTIAEFVGAMLERGTRTKSRQVIKDTFDKLKASTYLGGSANGAYAMVEVRKPQLQQTLELVAECLRDPAFDAKELEELRREMIASIEHQQDDPSAIGWRALSRATSPFPKGHPYYVPTWAEDLADTKAVKREELKAFHSRFYGARAGLVSVVGDFDPAKMKAQLSALFGDWNAPQPYVRIPRPYKAIEPKLETIQAPDKAMAFYGAKVAFPLKDTQPDFVPLLMADYLMGGGFLNGRVPKRLREEDGLSYSAGTRVSVAQHDDHSSMTGYAVYAPQNVEKVEKGFMEVFQKAVTGTFTEEELALAKEGMLRERQQQRSDDSTLANTLINQLDLDRTMAFEQAVDDKLKALTAAEASAALKKYVDPKKLTVVKVGDFKKLPAVR